MGHNKATDRVPSHNSGGLSILRKLENGNIFKVTVVHSELSSSSKQVT